MERPPVDPYSSPHAHDAPQQQSTESEYAPLHMQWGLIVWTIALMGLLMAIVWVVG